MRAYPDNQSERHRKAIQGELDALKSSAERSRLGQFATPYELAVEIARYVQAIAGQSLAAIRFADPAVGTGGFYSAVLTVCGRQRIDRAIGVEFDPAF
jgi:predicted RNA methylase